jgi:CRISPR/Cas system-associated exonuclease Cas4 (RecB family)
MKFQLHATALTLWSRCGEAFRRKYIENERTPVSVQSAVGTAVHRSSESDLKHKLETATLLPEEAVKDIARDTLVSNWDQVEPSPEDLEEGIDCSRDRSIDRAVTLASFHHSEVAPSICPTHVEREWVLDIDGLSLQLAGRIDWQEGTRVVGDTKTSTKSPAKDMADKSLQLSAYALAIKAHEKKLPDVLRLDYLVMTPKRGDTKLVQLTSWRTDEDLVPLLERVAQAERQIATGVFTPAPPDSWWCSAKFCPFFHSCRYALKPVSISLGGKQ